ncbi:hypothetical protein [Aureimonas psammosilenae]|uniref:hypothetical protein n=1 Tax=Aureimonas psammosilenae TaxID=2495496 RepID=UPI001260BE84|nr:hypothetical protein [Aureimonas psammosilenae]
MHDFKLKEPTSEDISAFVAEYQAKSKAEGRRIVSSSLIQEFARAKLACEINGTIDKNGAAPKRMTDEEKPLFGAFVIARNKLKAAEASVAQAAAGVVRATSPSPTVPPHIAVVRKRAAELGAMTPAGAHDLMSKALAGDWSDEQYKVEITAWQITNAGRKAGIR